MVDLTFKSPGELKALINNRPVYLWGASIVGFGICRSLERNNIIPKGFIDISTRLQKTSSLGYPVFVPSDILDTAHTTKPFIVITSGHYEDEIAQTCTKAGLVSGTDFISARSICPLDPSVDISGVCNLHCMSCPRGNMEHQPPKGFMKPDVYAQVLKKLLHELPFIGNVQLYAWGEPFLNPDVAEIIRMTVDHRVLCAISTNLNIRKDFSEAIKARPDWIKVSVSGYGKNYEETHTGGSWPLLLENLHKLKEYKGTYNPEMYVEINYHLYKRNTGDEFDKMKELSQSLGFAFRPNPAYLYSLDNLLAYRQGKALSPQAMQTLDMLLLPIDEGIARAEKQKHLACAEERCFPINWNLNVRFCGAYYEPVIVDNFLETPLAEIIRLRNASPFCGVCKSNALHRFTSVYVEEKREANGAAE